MSTIGQRVAAQAQQALEDALKEAAEEVLAESNANLPVGDPAVDPNPGFALVEHGTVTITHTETGPVATIHYDGPYAAFQHENQHAHHPRGGKSKWLEDALKSKLPELEGLVAGKVRARIKS